MMTPVMALEAGSWNILENEKKMYGQQGWAHLRSFYVNAQNNWSKSQGKDQVIEAP